MRIVALFAAVVAAMPLMAQEVPPQIRYEFGGSVLNHDMMWATDMAQLSRTHVFGTSRAMGMGGAFVSLGADLTSMSLNPAGLGMYRRNEVSVTPLVPVSHASTAGTQSWVGNNKTRFAVANVGAALNVFESPSGNLTSLTIGLGMNRIADFNTRYSFSSESLFDPVSGAYMPTIADIFSQQLNTSGLTPADFKNQWPNPNMWPAVLGYDGYMVGYFGDDETNPNPNNPWGVQRIGGNASVLHSMDVVNSGSINEFTLSVGGNINNIVYFGASLGIQSVHKATDVTYQEEYGYFNTDGLATGPNGQGLPEQLDMMNLYQRTVLDGSGVNFKLGVVVRPVAGLRLGAAFHTPTYYSLDRTYRAGITSLVRENATGKTVEVGNDTPTAENAGTDGWNFTSPARLMFGASYTFGNVAIVSVDYERDWYNGIRVKNIPEGTAFTTESGYVFSPEALKQQFKDHFKGTNSIRAGVEVKPLPMLALRAGGGYTDSMLKDRDYSVNNAYAGMPMTYESWYFSAGVGVNLSRSTTLDVAYQNVSEKMTDYQLFFSRDMTTGQMKTWSGLYDTKLTRHYISMTLSYRF